MGKVNLPVVPPLPHTMQRLVPKHGIAKCIAATTGPRDTKEQVKLAEAGEWLLAHGYQQILDNVTNDGSNIPDFKSFTNWTVVANKGSRFVAARIKNGAMTGFDNYECDDWDEMSEIIYRGDWNLAIIDPKIEDVTVCHYRGGIRVAMAYVKLKFPEGHDGMTKRERYESGYVSSWFGYPDLEHTNKVRAHHYGLPPLPEYEVEIEKVVEAINDLWEREGPFSACEVAKRFFTKEAAPSRSSIQAGLDRLGFKKKTIVNQVIQYKP